MLLNFLPGVVGTATTRLYDSYPFSVGFSLRKLRQAYTGPCLTVRRSSDSTELDVGFLRTGLVDTATIAAFCGSGSGFVRRWYDQSPNANHAVQTTANLQPRIYNAGVQEVNEFGRPGIRFIDAVATGFGQHLIFTVYHTAAQAYVGRYTAYCLVSAGTDPYLVGSDPLDRGFLSLHSGATRQVRTATIRSATSVANGTALTLGQTYIRHDKANRTRVQTYLDKTVAADIDIADSNTNFNLPTSYWLGSTNIGTVIVQDLCMHEDLGYSTNESDQLAIRTDMHDFWRS